MDKNELIKNLLEEQKEDILKVETNVWKDIRTRKTLALISTIVPLLALVIMFVDALVFGVSDSIVFIILGGVSSLMYISSVVFYALGYRKNLSMITLSISSLIGLAACLSDVILSKIIYLPFLITSLLWLISLIADTLLLLALNKKEYGTKSKLAFASTIALVALIIATVGEAGFLALDIKGGTARLDYTYDSELKGYVVDAIRQNAVGKAIIPTEFQGEPVVRIKSDALIDSSGKAKVSALYFENSNISGLYDLQLSGVKEVHLISPHNDVTLLKKWILNDHSLFNDGVQLYVNEDNFDDLRFSLLNSDYYRNVNIDKQTSNYLIFDCKGTTLELPSIKFDKTLDEETIQGNYDYFDHDSKEYAFGSWYLDEELTEKVRPGTTFRTTTILYGEWSRYYNITWNLNGGVPSSSELPNKFSKFDENIELPEVEKGGYKFLGWNAPSSPANGDIYPVGEKYIDTSLTKDIVLNATFTELYHITYDDGMEGAIKDGDYITSYTKYDTINLPSLSKPGYDFLGWRVGDTLDILDGVINKNHTGDMDLVGEWKPIQYEITFSDPKFGNNSEGEYNIETGFDAFPSLSQIGYTFEGWRDLSDNSMTSSIPTGIYGEKTYVAVWKAITYSISYNTNGGTLPASYPTQYTIEDTVNLPVPTKDYYTFDGWRMGADQVSSSFNGKNGDLSLEAMWTPVTYTISFNDDTFGKTAANISYDVEDSFPISLPSLTADGANFLGWENESGEVMTSLNFVPKNQTLKAKWELITYGIGYILDGGTLQEGSKDTYNVFDEFDLPTPSKNGYDFVSWKDATSGESVESISNGTTGNLEFAAEWQVVNYQVNYVDEKFGKVITSDSYNIETGLPSLKTLEEEGYNFLGWKDSKTGAMVSSIAIGEYGDRTLVSIWEAVEYSISIDLQGGTLSSAIPNTYTIESSSIVLPEPKKEGYAFTGWDDGTGVVSSIPHGSTGDVDITATWETVEYTISYVLAGGTFGSSSIPTSYNIESSTITLPVPTRKGYSFKGWNNGSGIVETIDNGSVGDLVLTATWEAIEYSISYDMAGGSSSTPLKDTYTIEDSFTLEKPAKDGYSFISWSDGDIDVERIDNETGNKSLIAKWETVEYTISYDLDGGNLNETIPNTYTIESLTIHLPEPTKEGYIFKGWNNGSEIVTSIEHGSTGDVKLTATWEAIEYSITYDLGGGNLSDDAIRAYTVESTTIELPTPSKTGYNFLGWDDGSGIIRSIEHGTTGDINLTATWSLIDYNIIYSIDGAVYSISTGFPEAEDYHESYTIESSFALPTPSKDGYEFSGWKVGATDEIIFEIVPGRCEQWITLNCLWTPIQYSISYDLDGGAFAGSDPITTYNIEQYVELETPVKDGCEFVGWEDENGEIVSAIEIGTKGNLSLKAIWALIE